MPFPSPTVVAILLLVFVAICWIVALVKRSKATGDEEVLLDIAVPPLSDWLVLLGCVAAAVVLLFTIGYEIPAILFPIALLLTGALMFADNLPAAITSRGLRRGLSITPWSEFASWRWHADHPHTLVLDETGSSAASFVAVPVTDPLKADDADETPHTPSPDDYPDWDSFRSAIETALGTHLPGQGGVAVSAEESAG